MAFRVVKVDHPRDVPQAPYDAPQLLEQVAAMRRCLTLYHRHADWLLDGPSLETIGQPSPGVSWPGTFLAPIGGIPPPPSGRGVERKFPLLNLDPDEFYFSDKYPTLPARVTREAGRGGGMVGMHGCLRG